MGHQILGDTREAGAPADKGELTILVADEAKVLSPAQLKELKATAASAAGTTGIRFSVFILPKLPKGERIDLAAYDIVGAHNLGGGRRGGILLVLSLKERQGWIWTTPSLNNAASSAAFNAVLTYIVLPNLREGNILRAAEDGTRALAMAAAGAYSTAAAPQMAVAQDPADIVPSGILPMVVGGVFLALLLGSGGWYTVPLIVARRF